MDRDELGAGGNADARRGAFETVDGEILNSDAPGPKDDARTVRGPGWIGRNRALIEKGRDTARIVLPLAPPPVRLGLVAASLAADGLLTLEDARTGRTERGEAGMRGVGLALDALTLAASARIAPAAVIRQAGRIATLRAVVSRLEQTRRPA
ncbi:MAG: hypothetical protein AAF416_17440 [Pseudomonadota bacterium]